MSKFIVEGALGGITFSRPVDATSSEDAVNQLREQFTRERPSQILDIFTVKEEREIRETTRLSAGLSGGKLK